MEKTRNICTETLGQFIKKLLITEKGALRSYNRCSKQPPFVSRQTEMGHTTLAGTSVIATFTLAWR